MRLTPIVACGALCLGLGFPASAQDAKKATAPAAHAEMPAPPKPGPEHALLKQDVGTWDATVEMLGPGAPPPSKGVETNTLTGGGLWLVTDFKGDFMGEPFSGHGVAGYDIHKGKYVGTWVDSVTTVQMPSESSYNPATKTMTGYMQTVDPQGKPAKAKTVTEWKGTDTRVFTLYEVGPDGKEAASMRITYKRRP